MYRFLGPLLAVCLLVVWGQPGLTQVLAHSQQNVQRTQPVAQVLQLKNVLRDLQAHYRTDILFFDQNVEGYSLKQSQIDLKNSLEKNLRSVLSPFGLRYKKMENGGYVVMARNSNKETGINLPKLNGLQTKSPAELLEVSGRVVDETGAELPGVSVVLKGSSQGTSTDQKGAYQINVADEQTVLVFSYVGYVAHEEIVGSRKTIDVTLKTDNKILNEVVVVGYGTKERRDITSAISSVNAKEIQNLPVASPVALLQGRTTGVQIVQNTGAPGATNFTIRVRGTTSINAGNNPLYIIDGLPVETGTSDINPNDIESLEILKDAAAAAIYGSRAANGVVLITTKRGKSGKAAINFNYYKAIQTVDRSRLPKLMNSSEWIELIQEQRANGIGSTPLYAWVLPESGLISGLGPVSNTNWLNEIIQTGGMDNYELSLRGGENKLKFYLSGALLDQKGTLINSDYKRYTGKLNLDYDVSSRFKLGTSLNFTRSATNSINENEGGVFHNALYKTPVMPVFNVDGSYFLEDASGYANPVAVSNLTKNYGTRNRLLVNAFGDFSILPGLTFRTSWGIDLVNDKNDFFSPGTSLRNGVTNGSFSRSDQTNWIYEHTLNYIKTLGLHRINGLLGYSQLQNNGSSSSGSGRGYGTNSVQTLNVASTPLTASSSETANGLSSIFGRAGYIYDNRYYFEASLRQDGSSKFGANNRYALFPAVSIGWRVGREAFFKSLTGIASDMKLRASYGRTGNQGGIGNYTSQGAYSTGRGYVGQNGVAATVIANPDLKWETTDQYNIGADFTLIKSRINFSVDAYLKNTSNLLLNVLLPRSSGFDSALQNIGNTENRGIEFNLNTVNLEGAKLNWTSNFNISFNKNRIIKLFDGQNIINTRGNGGTVGTARAFSILSESAPIGSFYGWQENGVYATAAENEKQLRADSPTGAVYRGGDIRFVDQNGDNIINDLDRVIIGYALPKFTGGFSNTLNYHNFQLDALLQFVYGNQVYNGTRTASEKMYGFSNGTKNLLNRWRNEGDITDVPRAEHNDVVGNARASTRWIEDGSYLRFKTVTLSYSVPPKVTKKIHVESLRLYATAQNLFTLTRYNGLDPESNSYGSSSVTDLGFDYAAYPQYKSFLFGINIGF